MSPEKPCKVWVAARTRGGYGSRKIGGRSFSAHRFAWEQAHGPIPDGMLVLHSCDNPPCYEVTHLFLGTQAENMADMRAKGRAWEQTITHCPKRHPYDDENTYVDSRGWRQVPALPSRPGARALPGRACCRGTGGEAMSFASKPGHRAMCPCAECDGRYPAPAVPVGVQPEPAEEAQ